MAQLFHRSSNALARASIFGAVVILGGLGWLLFAAYRSDYVTGAHVVREQPVPFSHKHHVGGEGIDCRYCHTSVEESAFAGMPATETCMTCHSQIWSEAPALEPVRASFRSGKPVEWTRVHYLADFVYFNHSIHVNKGIGCETCHGRVDQMPLTWQENSLLMQWCLDCHRQPELYVRPREAVFQMGWKPPADQLAVGRRLVKEYKIRSLTDCYTCHR
jgi:hypothetical protein